VVYCEKPVKSPALQLIGITAAALVEISTTRALPAGCGRRQNAVICPA
jgi:hypothetical protein